MPLPPRWWTPLVLVLACNHTPVEPRPSPPSSTGLPNIYTADGSAVPELPDAAPAVAPDAAAPDAAAAPDLRVLGKDAAVDAAAPALDAPEGEAAPPPPGEDAAVCSSTGATAKPVPVDVR